MGYLLDKLVRESEACVVKPEREGFTLVAKPGRRAEFSALVREASEHSGDDFLVFPTVDAGHGYCQMFVLPLDDARLS